SAFFQSFSSRGLAVAADVWGLPAFRLIAINGVVSDRASTQTETEPQTFGKYMSFPFMIMDTDWRVLRRHSASNRRGRQAQSEVTRRRRRRPVLKCGSPHCPSL